MAAQLPRVIAIDGPSASGKGTVAQRVAQAVGFHYLDSGALYRLVAVAAKQAGVAWGTALNGPNSIALSSAINGTNHATTRGFVQSNGCVVPTIGIRGDGVVPSESATALAGVSNYFVDSASNGLPSNSFVRQSVVSLLQGAVPAGVQSVPFVDPNHVVTTIYTCNPMKMRVTNPANYLTGRDASGNVKQDIPESQYFNFPSNEAIVADGTDPLHHQKRQYDNDGANGAVHRDRENRPHTGRDHRRRHPRARGSIPP